MAKPGIIIVKAGREKSLERRHPWLFSGAIDEQRSNLEGVEPGGIVEVRGIDGGFLGRGYYNPHSQIRVRILSWDQTEALGPGWWRIRIARAIASRGALVKRPDLDAYRLVHAESDGLPGLIVDRYGDYLVIQALTLGVEVVKQHIVEALVDLMQPRGIFERSDVDARHKEGLSDAVGLLYGEEPPTPLVITEQGVHYPVDVHTGHKTGFYLDQRDARAWLLAHPEVQGAEVLNCFSYTGSFTACAALNGAASITAVDSSQPALDMTAQTMQLNGLSDYPVELICADVFKQLREFRDEEREFDLIILDPPKFAQSAKHLDRATFGYKDINMMALDRLRPGGTLLTFSCSGLVGPDLFQKVVFGASIDAGVEAQIVGWFSQPADHPVLLAFPEGHYLKGLAIRVLGQG